MCPPEVRLGIGACQLRLGKVSKAEAAYTRVLELDPGCTQALLGLAVVEFSITDNAEATRRGSRLLAQAFREDPHNPHTLALLAHFSLQQGLAEAALRLAKAAKERVDVDDHALRAEISTLLGRAHHANGELADAMQSYTEALQLDAKQPSAQLAKAQLDASRGDLKAAVVALERVLDERPGWKDALRILAPLYPRYCPSGIAPKGVHHFKIAAERENSPMLWEMLGDILASADPANALHAYTTAINLHRKAAAAATNGENGAIIAAAAAVPARLLNNAAVLHFRSGNTTASAQLVAEAIASAMGGGLSELGPQAQVTLGYNAARVREANGDLKAAESEYTALLEQFPQYCDCYLRMATIATARGDIKEAENWAQRAADASGRSADTLALLSWLYSGRRDYGPAKKNLEELNELMKSLGMPETYAHVALGNVHLYSSPSDISKENSRMRVETHLAHALGVYSRVLEKDPGNVFAANGVGCILAESGRLNEAKEVFLTVQEAAAGTDGFLRLPDVWVNLAGVYLGLKKYTAAVQTYEKAMRRFPEIRDDPRVQLYLAKAQHEGGKSEAAIRTLSRTIHVAPKDPRLRYNLAVVLVQYADQVFEKKGWPVGDTTKVTHMELALRRIATADEAFRTLKALGPKATGIPPKDLEHRIEFAEMKAAEGRIKLEKATREVAATVSRMEANKARLEHEANKRRLDERKKELENEALQRSREAQAKEAAAKLERLKSEWRQGAVLAKAAAAGDASAVVTGRKEEEQQRQQEAMDAMFAEEEDDDEYVPGQADSGDEGGNGGGGGVDPTEGTAALLMAGLLSDDEEDGDEDFQVPLDGDDGDAAGKKKKKKQKKDTAGAAAVVEGEKKKQKKKEKGKKESSGSGGRLKKRGRVDEEEEEGAVAVGGGEVGGTATKKARPSAVMEDSDVEEAAEGAALGGDALAAGLKDLFGSDSD